MLLFFVVGFFVFFRFAVQDFDTPQSLKQGHGHQTWYELVDPKQGYNHTNAPEKGNVKAFAKSENMSIISLEYVGKKNKSDTFMIYLLCLTIPQWGAADAEIKVPSGENTEL